MIKDVKKVLKDIKKVPDAKKESKKLVKHEKPV